jgi:tripartite-type tricarboxylate transporter receptor subunit TctC
MQRRAFLAATSAAAAAMAAARPAAAQSWPAAARPIRVLVPFGLGGSADVAARFLAEPLSVALGVPVVVENRPGGGAVIGTDIVAKAPPDGHTLLMMSNTHTANETLLPNRPYVLLRDLVPVAAVNVAYHVLAVHPSLPAATLPELIAHARAHPGRLDYASSGPGTPYHIAGEVFCAMAGIRMNHVPFRGSNEARTALIAARLNAEVNRILGLAETRDAQARAGAQPTPMTVAAFGEFLARDIERQREWIRMARIEAN